MARLKELVGDALRCLEEDDAERALAKARQALALSGEAGGADGAADAVRIVMHATNHMGKCEESIELATAEIAKLSRAGDSRGEAIVRLALAETYAHCRGQTKHDEALEAVAEARELLGKVGGEKGLEAEALLAEMNIHMGRGDSRSGHWVASYQRALHLGKEALELFQRVEDVKGQARATHGIAAARMTCKGFEGGIRTAKDALRLWQSLGIKKYEVQEMQSIVMWYVQAGMPKQAIPFAQEALELVREEHSSAAWEASVLHLIVQVLCASGQTSRALQIALDRVARCKEAKEARGHAAALRLLVDVYAAQGASWQALQSAKQASTELLALGEKHEVPSLLRTVTRLSLQLQRYDDALRAAKDALALCKELGTSMAEHLDCMRALVAVHVSNQQIKEALQMVEEERDYFAEQDSVRGEAMTLFTIVDLHLEDQAYQEAIWAAEDAKSLFDDAEDVAGQAAAAQAIVQIHMSAKDYNAAMEASESALSLFREVGDTRGEFGTRVLILQAHELKLAASQLDTSSQVFRQGVLEALNVAKGAMAVAEGIGEKPLVASASCLLSRIYHMAVKGADALRAATSALAIYRQLADKPGEAYALVLCANAHIVDGKDDEAKQAAGKALLLYRQLGDTQGEQLAEDAIDAAEYSPEVEVSFAAAPSAAMALPAAAAGALLDKSAYKGKVRTTVVDIVGIDDLENETPLMQAGLTSQSAVLLRNALAKDMGGGSLPFTLMFDFPSVSSLAEYFMDRDGA